MELLMYIRKHLKIKQNINILNNSVCPISNSNSTGRELEEVDGVLISKAFGICCWAETH